MEGTRHSALSVALVMLALLSVALAIPILPPESQHGEQTAGDSMRFKSTDGQAEAPIGVVPQEADDEGDIPAAALEDPDDAEDVDDNEDQDDPDMSMHEHMAHNHNHAAQPAQPRFAQQQVAASPATVTIPAKQFRAQTKKSLNMLDGMMNQLNKMSDSLTSKLNPMKTVAAIAQQQQTTTSPTVNGTNTTNATNPVAGGNTSALNATGPAGNGTVQTNGTSGANSSVLINQLLNNLTQNASTPSNNTVNVTGNATANNTGSSTVNNTGNANTTVTNGTATNGTSTNTTNNVTSSPNPPDSGTPGQNKLSSSACYKWIPTTSKRHDERQGTFSWLSKDGKKAYVIGGCDGANHVKRCANTVETLLLDEKPKPNNLQSWDSNNIDYKGDLKLKGRSIMYAHDRPRGHVYDFGGTRDMGNAGMKMVNILGKLAVDQASGRWKWEEVAIKNAPTDTINVPPAFEDGTLVATRSTLILFGGFNAKGFRNDLYYMRVGDAAGTKGGATTFQWRKITPKGTPPAARSGHSATVVGNVMYVFGGTNAKGVLSDVHKLVIPDDMDTGTWEWKLVSTKDEANKPSPRAFHSAILMPGQLLFIMGGMDTFKREFYNDVKILALQSMSWIQVPNTFSKTFNVPKFRKGSVLSVGQARSTILLFGGCVAEKCNNVFSPVILDTDAVCANSCRHGNYKEIGTLKIPQCKCADSWTGKFCDTRARCKNGCSGKGKCVAGKCQCDLGFGGEDCSKQVCPNDCSGDRGDCSLSEKRCICKLGNWGLDCAQNDCPHNCYGRGICQKVDRKRNPDAKNFCKCKKGFSGPACQFWGFKNETLNVTQAAQQTQVNKGHELTRIGNHSAYDMGFSCPNHCSGHGICKKVISELGVIGGKCECELGFGGRDCAGECSLHCTSPRHGKCIGADASRVKCQCNEGYRGVGCSSSYCARNCSNHGSCEKGECLCHQGYAGGACELDISCSGHGKFVAGKCICDAYWGGLNCQQKVTCPGNGTGIHGVCRGMPVKLGELKTSGGYWHCESGWTGRLCNMRTCKKKCSLNGECRDGTCKCYPGWAKEDCSLRVSCPNNCTSATHGKCRPDDNNPGQGVCDCNAGWGGPACHDIGCPNKCYGRGSCQQGVCKCDAGYSGKDCGTMCPKRCSGHGDCFNEQCNCHPGYSGPDCNTTARCPGFGKAKGECSGHGTCYKPTGKCFCDPGHTGDDCSQRKGCGEKGCGPNGGCVNGKCYCNPGFEGKHCEIKSSCQNDCGNHGMCHRGKCFCHTGFKGDACEQMVMDPTCTKNCSGNGVCRMGRCFCVDGYSGVDCSKASPLACQRFTTSKFLCEGRGLCKYGKCFCNPGFAGKFCHEGELCKKGCVQGQGVCFNGQCLCRPGFKGDDCSEDIPCPGSPLPCSGNGVCMQGQCGCLPGWNGADCSNNIAKKNASQTACPGNCTDGGVCFAGKCFCVPGRSGKDCSHKLQGACRFNCGGSQRGRCQWGRCFCNPGYAGPYCQKELTCTAKCLENGRCAYGKCFCAAGWKGVNCDIREDQGTTKQALENDIERAYQALVKRGAVNDTCAGCNFHGVCLAGKCLCEPPYYGKYCEMFATGALSRRCPNNCNNRGQCLFGKCFCDLGFVGKACEKKESLPCPNNCGGNGVCHHGKCNCKPGFGGPSCGLKTVGTCKPACDIKHGVCQNGKCVCEPSWGGPTCSDSAISVSKNKTTTKTTTAQKPATQQKQAPAPTKAGSNAGASMKFREQEAGEPPAIQAILGASACENDCSPNGVCLYEQCYCKQGFSGPDCSTKEDELHAATASPDAANHVDKTLPKLSAKHTVPLSAAAPAKTNFTVHLLFGCIGFFLGILACLGLQAMYSNYKSAQLKRARHKILTPLIRSTMDT